MAGSDRDRQREEGGSGPETTREHVREMQGHLREMGEYLHRMSERLRELDEQLSHTEALDDKAVDIGRGWPTGG